MLKKHMAACLVASAFITMPVLAQTSTSPGATSPGTTQPATSSSGGGSAGSGAASSGGAGRFITEQQSNQWRASRLIGIDVYGADNQKIGDVNEVLVDRQGNADAVVVGVGGFLGIGEKNVALPFSAFEWQMDDSRRTASAGGSGSGGGGAGSGAGAGRTSTTAADATTAGAAGAGTAGPGTTATTGAGTGAAGSPASTASTGTTGGSSASGSTQRGYPDHAVLRMSKADLENAPTFRYVGENRSDTGSGSGGAARSGSGAGGSATGTGAGSPGTAPRQ